MPSSKSLLHFVPTTACSVFSQAYNICLSALLALSVNLDRGADDLALLAWPSKFPQLLKTFSDSHVRPCESQSCYKSLSKFVRLFLRS